MRSVRHVLAVVDQAEAKPVRCELAMSPDGAVEVTLLDGCAMPDAIDLCRLLVGKDTGTRSVTVRPSESG
jgi:hypothetical protein